MTPAEHSVDRLDPARAQRVTPDTANAVKKARLFELAGLRRLLDREEVRAECCVALVCEGCATILSPLSLKPGAGRCRACVARWPALSHAILLRARLPRSSDRHG